MDERVPNVVIIAAIEVLLAFVSALVRALLLALSPALALMLMLARD